MDPKISPPSSAVVLAVGPLPPPVHGAAKVTAKAIAWMRDAGLDVHVVNTAADGNSGFRYHASRIARHFSAAMRVVALSRRGNRRLYLGGAGGNGLWYQAGLIGLARVCGYRIVFHHHSFAYCARPTAGMHAVSTLAGAGAVHIVLCSRMRYELMRRYGRIRRCVIVSNAFALDEVAEHPETRDVPSARTLILGHLSNLSLEKGLAECVNALRVLKAAGVPAQLRLGGVPIDARSRAALAAALQEFTSEIDYRGRLSDRDIGPFMAGLDFFLFPSRYRNEAEPMVAVEAARAGVEVIAYAVGCLRKWSPSGRWLVPDGSDFSEFVLNAVTHDATGAPAAPPKRLRSRFTRLRLLGLAGLQLAAVTPAGQYRRAGAVAPSLGVERD